MNKDNIFEENLKNGIEGEKLLKPKLKEILIVKMIEQINWKDEPQLQKKGIDAKLHQKPADIEIKTRSHEVYKKWHDILLETETYGKKGWFYSSQADLISYTWWNSKQKTNFVQEGYIIILTQKLREWFDKNKEKFTLKKAHSQSKDTGSKWITKNRAVPIDKFPNYSLVKYNPQLDITEQKKLKEFVDKENKKSKKKNKDVLECIKEAKT